jgi:hypothetical protein
MNPKPPARKSLPPDSPHAGGRHDPEKTKRTCAMTYGSSTSAFIENGPVEQVAKARALRSTARNWRALKHARRLELIERALNPANDEFPLAL